jgi:hypothetical protein
MLRKNLVKRPIRTEAAIGTVMIDTIVSHLAILAGA